MWDLSLMSSTEVKTYRKKERIRTARTSNSKEPQQKYRLGTVSIKILNGLNRFYGIPTSPSVFVMVMAQNIQLFGPRGGFLTHLWIITGNK